MRLLAFVLLLLSVAFMRLLACVPLRREGILKEYPDTQMLPEALQNAEDSGASQFTLMLDLRQHRTVDRSLGGRAFVFADDGGGFADKDWKSFANIQDSAKRHSPRDVGSFGRGSRSYFHWSDLLLVRSNGQYVGVDPLNRIDTHGRKDKDGWKQNMEVPVGPWQTHQKELQEECHTLFDLPPNLPVLPYTSERGAVFRLPLRSEADVASGLGGHITSEQADELLSKWCESLKDGNVLLFLTSVTRIELWRWDDGESAPVRLSMASKQLLNSSTPFSRLPDVGDTSIYESYGALSRYLKSLDESSRQKLSTPHVAMVEIRVDIDAARAETSRSRTLQYSQATRWRVMQRFDALDERLLTEIYEGCEAVPVVGVAFCEAEEARPPGSVFTFLPVADVQTRLPVHLNASFRLLPNRRSLWLGNLGTRGRQAKDVKWNDILMSSTLPRLWRDLLLSMCKEGTRTAPSVLSCLPLPSNTHKDWQCCASGLLKLIFESKILLHDVLPTPGWVSPCDAWILDMPSRAFRVQEKELMQLYKELAVVPPTSAHRPIIVISLSARQELSQELKRPEYGLRVYRDVDDFLGRLLDQAKRHNDKSLLPRLFPAFLAFAEHLSTGKNRGSCGEIKRRWRSELESLEWVPLAELPHGYSSNIGEVSDDSAGSNPLRQALVDLEIEPAASATLTTLTAKPAAATSLPPAKKAAAVFVRPIDAFAPGSSHLTAAKLRVVEAATADLTCKGVYDHDAVLSSLVAWGLKQELTWDDVLREAGE